jgi:hypothetical protein
MVEMGREVLEREIDLVGVPETDMILRVVLMETLIV